LAQETTSQLSLRQLGCDLVRAFFPCWIERSSLQPCPEKAARLRQTRLIESPLRIQIPPDVLIFDDLRLLLTRRILSYCAAPLSRRGQSSVNLQGLLGKRPSPSSAPVKGLELTTSKRMSEVVTELSGDLSYMFSLRTKPGWRDSAGLACSVVACKDAAVAATVQRMLSVANFRVYSNENLMVLSWGHPQNVIAIADGRLRRA